MTKVAVGAFSGGNDAKPMAVVCWGNHHNATGTGQDV